MKETKQNKNPYAASRLYYYIACLAGYLISIITTGAYLAKLTEALGIKDSLTAIITSLVSLAGICQFVAMFLSQHPPYKRFGCPLYFSSSILYSFLYFLPILGLPYEINVVLFFIAALLSPMLKQAGMPVLHDVYYAPIPKSELGKFGATNSIISYIGAAIFSYLAASYIDYCNEMGNTRQMFLVIAIAVATLSVIELICHSSAKEKPSTRSPEDKPTIKKDLIALFTYKPYVKQLIFYVFYNISLSFLNPFIGTYQISELGFSMTRIYVISLIQAAVSVVFLFVFSRYSATHSSATSLKIGLPIRILALALFFFIHPTGELGFIMMIVYMIVNSIAGAFTDISTGNIIYEVVPPHLRVSANAGLAVIGGIMAFLATLAISPLFDFIQGAELSASGVRIYAQQILGLISAAAMTLTLLYYLKFIKNLKAPSVEEDASAVIGDTD